MGMMTIRDNALWAKNVEEDPEIVRRILALPENAAITLIIEGEPVVFRKMRDGSDGRPTNGLRPDAAFKPFWDRMQSRRGERVSVRLCDAMPVTDPYLASISGLLSEWSSPEDAEAYDGL
jgi:hypothetical protein